MATFAAQPTARLFVRPGKRRADDIFFTTMSFIMLGIVLVGFAPSYFLKGALLAHLPSAIVHLHGAVFSSWILLFVIQSSLVSAGNVRLHRKLGVLGTVIAAFMVVLGILATFGTLHRHAVLPSFFTPESFLVTNVLGMIYFGVYVAVAVWQRSNSTVHKRLMLIANAMLMAPALSRMLFFVPLIQHHPFLVDAIPLAMIVSLCIFDLFTHKRPLAVTVIGGFLFWAADPLSDAILKTSFAQHLTVWAQHHP